MSQDLRLYFLSLIIVLALWTVPGRADYGSGCPTLAVPIQLQDGDIWHGGLWDDYRDIYPYSSGAGIYITNPGTSGVSFSGCVLDANEGTYYDGANHLWVLEEDISCDYVSDEGDFRAGDIY